MIYTSKVRNKQVWKKVMKEKQTERKTNRKIAQAPG
jgi:hypothetical protein